MDAQDVYRLLRQIPSGRVTTYGAIAGALKQPKACRRVGQILKRNPHPIAVPCHRVVCSDGRIGGYAGHNPAMIRRKMMLLASEGIAFKPGKGIRVASLRCFLFSPRIHIPGHKEFRSVEGTTHE